MVAVMKAMKTSKATTAMKAMKAMKAKKPAASVMKAVKLEEEEEKEEEEEEEEDDDLERARSYLERRNLLLQERIDEAQMRLNANLGPVDSNSSCDSTSEDTHQAIAIVSREIEINRFPWRV